MQKLLVLFSFVLVVFLTGCANSPTTPTNNNNNTQSTDTSSYLPLTTANSWTYAGNAGSYTVTVLGDTTFGGYTWKVTNNSAAAGHGYMRKEGSVYKATALPGYIIPGVVTALDETPGAQWIWDLSTQPGVTEHYVYTNSAQGLTKTVLSKTYTNVIDVKMDRSRD